MIIMAYIRLPSGFLPTLFVVTGFMQRSFLQICNTVVTNKVQYNDHLIFQCVIDCWGKHLDAGMSGASNVVAAHGFSSHNCLTKK